MSKNTVPYLRTVVDGPIQPSDTLDIPEHRPSLELAKHSGELAFRLYGEVSHAIKLAPTEKIVAASITTVALGALLFTN